MKKTGKSVAGKQKFALPKGARRAVETTFLQLCEAIDSPVSLGAYLRFTHGEHLDLANMHVDASHYLDPHSFYMDYQAVSFLAKYPHLNTGIDTSFVGMVKFIEAEDKCFHANNRFRNYFEMVDVKVDSFVEMILHSSLRKIEAVLGPVPTFESMDFRFGPGASLGVRGDTSVYKKLTAPMEATASMIPLLPDFLGEFPGWVRDDIATVTVVRGSELTFVPKNAKTDRPICIEPLLNGLMQKGIGTVIRERLRRHGVNLNDQTRNQRLASVAWRKGLATVDLSSASDTISYGLVLHLLPEQWFELLFSARSPSYSSQGNWYPMQKFSSMGNAYTFELESLIFWALAKSVIEHVCPKGNQTLGVYGDDLIIPTASYEPLQRVLDYCGFAVNERKTFSGGVFHESCGSDWFLGVDVRPFFIKKRVTSLLDLTYLANVISRIAHKASQTAQQRVRLGSIPLSVPATAITNNRDVRFRSIWQRVVDLIPRSLRFMGPDGFGDGFIVSEFDEACPKPVAPSRRGRDQTGWEGWEGRVLCFRPARARKECWPEAYALYHAGLDTEAAIGYDIRGRGRIAIGWEIFPFDWKGLGPWVE